MLSVLMAQKKAALSHCLLPHSVIGTILKHGGPHSSLQVPERKPYFLSTHPELIWLLINNYGLNNRGYSLGSIKEVTSGYFYLHLILSLPKPNGNYPNIHTNLQINRHIRWPYFDTRQYQISVVNVEMLLQKLHVFLSNKFGA